MAPTLKCRCVYLTVNPWARTLEARAARATASDCPLHGDGPIRWKRSTGDFVESHNGQWWITPIYGGLTRPERYDLQIKTPDGWKVVGGGSTQRECKEDAARLDEMGAEVAANAKRANKRRG